MGSIDGLFEYSLPLLCNLCSELVTEIKLLTNKSEHEHGITNLSISTGDRDWAGRACQESETFVHTYDENGPKDGVLSNDGSVDADYRLISFTVTTLVPV